MGYYHIIMGAQLALVIMVSVGILLYKVYTSPHNYVNFLHLGMFLLVLLLFFVVCILAIRTGLLFVKCSPLGLRGAVLVQLVQLISCVNHSFTYVFHLGLFYGFGFYQKNSLPRIWGEQKSLMGSAVIHIGAPYYKEHIVPINSAFYVNLTALLCLLLLVYLICFERNEKKSLPKLPVQI